MGERAVSTLGRTCPWKLLILRLGGIQAPHQFFSLTAAPLPELMSLNCQGSRQLSPRCIFGSALLSQNIPSFPFLDSAAFGPTGPSFGLIPGIFSISPASDSSGTCLSALAKPLATVP